MQMFINTPGALITQKDGCFRLKAGEKKSDRSPMKVESFVISNKAMISSQAIALAMENNIDVIFLDGYGDPVGRVWFSKMGSTALIRRRQLEASDQPLGLELAKDMVCQKIDNQTRFLKRLMSKRPGKEALFTGPLETIADSLLQVRDETRNIEAVRNRIMGLEGAAGKAFFRCLSEIMPERHRFYGRSRRPAKDPFNAVLNYFYGILYSQVEKECILSGIDPYVGFLHTDDYNKRSMVFDLIEPFRIFAEQTTFYLFTRKKIRDDFFDVVEDGVFLNQKGKPVVVDAFKVHLDESVRYRRRNVKRRYIVRHEAHRLANLLLKEDGEERPEWLEIEEF